MSSHPNQTFAMHNDWQPEEAKLAEVLWFKFQLNMQLSEQIFSSDWYQQKLNEFRFEQKNRFDEYLDQKKNNEYGWMLEFSRMLKQGYIASRRVNEHIQQGKMVEKDPNDPQHSNVKKLLAKTEQENTPQARSQQVQANKKPIFVPEAVDREQLDRFVQFFIELTERKPLRSQMETWISQLSVMTKQQQQEQINYAISIGKTIIYPPRPALDVSQGGVNNPNAGKRKHARSDKAALEAEKHQLNLSFNGIRLSAHIHRAALTAFIDERFQQEKKAMTPTRLQALVDMLSSMNTEEQANAIRQAIIGNYKTIYAPKPSQQTPRTAMQASQDAANKMKQRTGEQQNRGADNPSSVHQLKNSLFLNKPNKDK